MDINKLDVDEEGDMFMELKSESKIICLLKMNLDQVIEPFKRVRRHYLDSAVVNKIKNIKDQINHKIDLNSCSDKVYNYFMEEIQDEILSQRVI